ncbi:hypothetical protein ACLOJK_014096 [Asimina triloba]
MAEAGALDALTKYLSLSPQDSTEATISDLLRILFGNSYLLHHKTSLSALNQLIAVLHLGSRSARFSAARTLQELFDAKEIRDSEVSKQAIPPLVDMLNVGSEREHHAALAALVKLTSEDSSKVSLLAEVEVNPIESLYKILSSTTSLELKRNAAQLCYVLFESPKVRSMPMAADCMHPLMALMESDENSLVECGLYAFERLLEDEQQAEVAASYNIVGLLVGLISGSNYQLIEACIRSLIKLGKDRPHCKLEMIESGIVDNALEMLSVAPSSLCSSIAELLRILTNNSNIARSPAAARMVNPLFLVLQRPGFSMGAQHSTLQALVNILEKRQSPAVQLTPSEVIEPLICFLKSPSQAIQQLSTELLSHILAQDHFQQDITAKNAVVPLVQLVGIGMPNLQQAIIKAVESISRSWPKAVADAGGITVLSKLISEDKLEASHALWESAATVVANILQKHPENYFKVSRAVLVKMLHSTAESTITAALSALIAQERSDDSAAVSMTEAGGVDVLLELLRSHQCEEASARLLEALFNNAQVREKKVSKHAIAPLSRYLLDPQTSSQPAKLLAALALGDLFQQEGLARASDSVTACRALVSVLEDHPTEEMKMVAICALQNLVMHNRTNRRAVAEAGGVSIIQELLLSSESELAGQEALLIKFLFSNHTLQEYVSNELIRSLTGKLLKRVVSHPILSGSGFKNF